MSDYGRIRSQRSKAVSPSLEAQHMTFVEGGLQRSCQLGPEFIASLSRALESYLSACSTMVGTKQVQ